MTSNWRYFYLLASYVNAPDAGAHSYRFSLIVPFIKTLKIPPLRSEWRWREYRLRPMCWYRLSVSLICWRSFLALWRYFIFSRHPEPPVGRCRRIFVLFVRVLYLYSGVKWDFSFSMTSNWRYFCLLASYVNAPDAEAHFRPLFSHCAFYKNVKDSSTSVGMTLERIPLEAYVLVSPVC